MLPMRYHRTARRREPAEQLGEQPGYGWGLKPSKALCDAGELPEWYPASPYIKRRYRVGYDACECVGSVVEVHNETCNVWSHASGAVFFGTVTVRRLRFIWGPGCPAGARTLDELSMVAFTAAATAMLFASAGYHTFHPLGRVARRRWLQADKFGIALMIAGSIVPGVWLGFRCAAPVVRRAWLAVALVVLVGGGGLAVDCVEERHHLPAFATLVASGLAPTVHWVATTPRPIVAAFLPRLLLMFALYGLGLIFYATRWPECRHPGAYDLIGASHQLWHLCVVLAALTWLDNLEDFVAMVHREDGTFNCADHLLLAQ